MSTNLDDVIIALHEAWDHFEQLADDLPDVFITIGAGSGPPVDRDDERTMARVFISDETLSYGPIATLSALAHDAAHLLAERRHVGDTSDRGRYHSATFAHLAAQLGFEFVPPDGPIGKSRYGTAELRPLLSNYQRELKALADALPSDRTGAPIPVCRSRRVARPSSGASVKAVCRCAPVRIIYTAPSTLRGGAIMCAKCQHRFALPEA